MWNVGEITVDEVLELLGEQLRQRQRLDSAAVATHDLSNPILNSPYEPPREHFELGRAGPDRRGAAGPAAERVVHPGPGQPEGRRARRAAGARLRRHRRAARAEHADQRHPARGRAVAGEQLERRHAVHPQAARSTGPSPTARTRCCSASARRPRRRSSWPRSPVGTAPPTTAAGSSRRTRSTTTACPASG